MWRVCGQLRNLATLGGGQWWGGPERNYLEFDPAVRS